ncbi:MAG: YceI family protein, partial [Bradymonadaceae bacterium]
WSGVASHPEDSMSQQWRVGRGESSIAFSTWKMFFIPVSGEFDSWKAEVDYRPSELAETQIWVQIDASSVDTGNPMRDSHLRSSHFLDVENHPSIAFRSTSVEQGGEDRARVEGNLEIAGENRSLTFDAERQRGSDRHVWSAQLEIDRYDWNVAMSRFLEGGGQLIGNILTIDLELVLRRQEG